MDKFLSYFVVTILIIGSSFGVGYPLIYSFQHDSLTQMQVFKMFWYLEFLAIICVATLGAMYSD